jgi:hypothetical protein
MATPSLLLIPDRYKSGVLYSQLPESGAGDLDFTRGSTATRVNASGLIESVASGVPRLDYTGGGCPSLLLEPQRTNLITFSEQFDNGAWVKNETTISANIATSPSGLQDADKIIPNTNNTSHNVDRVALTVSLNGTASVFLKASGYNKAAIRSYFTGAYASFDLVNGTILTAVGVTAKIENYGNGWYRCSVNDTGNASYGYVLAVLDASSDPTATYIGDGTSGVLAWGAQLEVGSYPTSYIPTTTASVTRLADAASKTGISSLIGQTAGTLFLDFVYTELDVNGLIPVTIGSNSSNHAYFYIEGNNRINFDFLVAGSDVLSIATAIGFAVKGTRYKVALAYEANNFAAYINGQLIGTQNSGSIAGFSEFYFGYPYAAGYSFPLNVSTAALYTTRLSNSELASITTL